ncbi:MAG TPA: hypothetical protein VGN57_18565 [Pirellulaceae bacterium]|jgi:hypothetical protein|nr:hypothetical protein [Pirellulaceae bacterium]
MHEPSPIQVRQIEGNAIRATLAIRVPRQEGTAPAKRYRGEVYGPLASDRTTLPASYRLPEFAEDEEVRAVVTDPCFWSAEAPLEYEIVLTAIGESGDALKKIIRLRPRSELT